jgi:hypothetical protein
MSDSEIAFYKRRAKVGALGSIVMGYRTCTLGIPGGGVDSARVISDSGEVLSLDLISTRDKTVFPRWVLRDFYPLMEKIKKPWMLINGDTNAFRFLKLTSEELESIQREGLHIYMHEPMFVTDDQGVWPRTRRHKPPAFPELNSIARWIEKNEITSSVVFHVCEPRIADYFKQNKLFTNFKFVHFSCYHLFYDFYSRIHPWPTWEVELFDRRIICLNYRYEAIRELLVGFLRGIDSMNNSYVSFFHHHEDEEFRKRLPFDPASLKHWPSIEEGIKSMQPEVPYTLEVKRPAPLCPSSQAIPYMFGAAYEKDDWEIKQFYSKSFCALICESRPNAISSEISEKTLNCIFMGRPFIIVASECTLQSVRDLGFKTFSNLWDESYDTISDPVKRLDAVFDLVQKIQTMPETEIRDLARKAEAIVEYNRHYLQTGFAEVMKSRLIQTHRGGFINRVKNFLCQ